MFTFIPRDYLKVVYNARYRTAMTRLRTRNNRLLLKQVVGLIIVFLIMSVIVNIVSPIVLRMSIILFWNVRFIKSSEENIYPVFIIGNQICIKFVKLMSTGNKCVLRKLAAFIFHALKIRDDSNLIDEE